MLLLLSPILPAQEVPHRLDSYTIRSVVLEADVSFSRYFLQHYLMLAPGYTYTFPQLQQQLLHLQALSALQLYLGMSFIPRYREDGSVDVYVLGRQRERELQLVGGSSGVTGEGGSEGGMLSFAWPQFINPGGLLQFDLGLKQGVQLRLPYLFGSILGLRFVLANQLYPLRNFSDPGLGPEESALGEFIIQPYPSLEFATGARGLWLLSSQSPGLVDLGLGELEMGVFARVFWNHYFALAYQAFSWQLGLRGEYFLHHQSLEVSWDAALFAQIFSWMGAELQLALVASLEQDLRPSSWFRLNYWTAVERSGSLIYQLSLNIPLQLLRPLPHSFTSLGFGLQPSLLATQLLHWQQLELSDWIPQLLLFIGPFLDVTVGSNAATRLTAQLGVDLQSGDFLLRFSAGRYFFPPPMEKKIKTRPDD